MLPPSERRPLAVVDGRAVSLADLQRRIAGLPENLRPKTREATERLLVELVDLEVLAAEARRRGFDHTPEGRAVLAAGLAEVAMSERLMHLPGPESVPHEEVERYYRENLSRYTTPELRRLSAVSFATRAEAEAARRAGEVRGRDLGEVSDPSAHDDVDDRRGAEVPPPLVAAGFALATIGDVSPPVEHEGRHWLVVFSGRTAGEVRPLAREDGNIRRVLAQRAREQAAERWLEELRRANPRAVDGNALDDVSVVGDLEAYDPARWKKRR